MKLKTSELQGAALDWAVAKCELGEAINEVDDPHFYSTDWAQGGPIIEREEVSLDFDVDLKHPDGRWLATRVEDPAFCEELGPTPLIAAMRVYVASKLGDEVGVPDEIL